MFGLQLEKKAWDLNSHAAWETLNLTIRSSGEYCSMVEASVFDI